MSDRTSDGERVQQLVIDWLNRNFPDGPTWYDEPANSPPIEIRMIGAFNDIEYNIGNGGWAQFLWNCFDYWRKAIEDGREGYRLIGAAEQSAALDTLWALCERDERECAETMARPEWEFAQFTSRSYSAPPNDWEHLFYDDGGAHEKRLAWFAANEARVRKAIGMM